jgi:hypothetical protein
MTGLDWDTAGKWLSRVPIVKLQYRKPSEGVPEVVSALSRSLNSPESGDGNGRYKFPGISITDCFIRVAV